MKSLRMIMAAGVLVAMAASCAKENNIKVVLPPDVAELSGVEAMYERGLHEYLEIAPTVNFVNYTEENKDSVKYEWNIDYKVVGTDSVLTFKCDKNGQFNGYLKVSTSTGAKIADFKLTVTTPYDKGLLMLSGTGEGSMLTWKRLDIMDTPACPYAFKDNNPTLELGKSPLALCWKGEGITSPKAAQLTDNYYEVLVSTENPVKVYALNTNDMTVRTEITYNGSGEFHPNAMLCPKGTQEGVWNNMQDVVYFVGGGRDYIMTSDRNFVAAEGSDVLPAGAAIADYTCVVGQTNASDYVRAYFNKTTHKLVYHSALMAFEATERDKVLSGEPIFMKGCDGEYYKERYDAMAIMLVTADGAATKVYRFDPDAAIMGETVLSEIDASGKILPESAIAVNPIKTILYYSNGNKIYRLNYDGEIFDSEPYITLDGNYTAKKMIFNVYDAKTLYIAAENADEQSEMKASMFIYDISDDASAKLLFKGDKVGGTVKDLIYKGNGREYESIPSEKALSRLFR